MDGNNWRANSGQSHVPDPVMGGEAPAAPGMAAGDWRTQLSADSRQRIVNKIMDTLTRHLPSSGQEGQQELKKIAIRFEEKTYASSTSQSDYLRKISSKMLTMETKSQNSMAISLQSNAPTSQRMQSQVPNQGQSNLNPLQPNSNVLPTQHVKQEQQMFPTTQQQIKQQIQKRQILEQYMQRQQFIQQQQQQQQHHQQTNQQQSAQLSAHQMLRLQQISETNEMKMRQQMGLKSGALQQHHSSGQRSSYHQPLKPGTPFSISSPQVLQAASPQVGPHSNGASNIERPRIEANHALEEELLEINERLIDTVVYISDEDMDPTAVAATAKGGDGTIVKCSFSAVALSPNLKSQYASAQMSPIQPLRVLVPNNYPNCSPILLDKFPVEVSKEYEDLSIKAKSRFSISLRTLSQPMTLGEIARTWDICARAVISEYAQQSGGGSFSSKYGTWENCLTTA